MENSSIVLHSIEPNELREVIREMIRSEFEIISIEMQRIIGEDDLISTGSACRILGICSKVFRILVKDGHFTVFHHMKERRFIRAEILNYRNKWRVSRSTL